MLDAVRSLSVHSLCLPADESFRQLRAQLRRLVNTHRSPPSRPPSCRSEIALEISNAGVPERLFFKLVFSGDFMCLNTIKLMERSSYDSESFETISVAFQLLPDDLRCF